MKGASSPAELWLIRHGESIDNREQRYQGQRDGPLSPLGKEQALRLAQRLQRLHASCPFAVLYSSDLTRAVATAQPTSQALGLPLRTQPSLREIDVGAWSGLTFGEIAHKYPAQWAASFPRMDPDLVRGGGESYRQAQERIVAAIDHIARAHPDERVLVFFHGGVMRAYLAHLLGFPLSNLRRLRVHNAAINRVRLDTAQRENGAGEGTENGPISGVVLSVNDLAHLE